MHFHEAREEFRDLEAKFFSGELAEGDFLDQVAQLRVTDAEGREWIISARNGRWLVHDGRQWVFAEPPQEGETLAAAAGEPRPEPVVPLEPWTKPKPKPRPKPQTQPKAKPKRAARAAPSRTRAPRQTPAQTPSPAAMEKPRRKPVAWPRLRIPFRTTRVLSGTLSALLVVACIVAVGVSAWVLFLRDLGEPDSVSLSGEPSSVAPVETYTPRPATPTYTPTATPTPSRTSTPTITPPATHTPQPSPSSTATETAPPTAPPAPTAPPPPTAQTYTVAAGDTLSEIATRFGVSTDALARANGISDPALIRDGQVLVIPSASATPTWTPIVLAVVSRTTTATATPSPTVTRVSRTPTATAGVTATATRRPTNTPKPAVTATARPTATPKPVALSGKIAFTVWNTSLGKYELYVSRIDGSGRNLLGQGYRQPQFRQDGNMLAVNGDGMPNFEHLVRMDSSGGGVVEISNFSEDALPTWSPDGNIVAYSSLAWGDGQSRLGIVHDIFGKDQDWIHIGTTEIRGEYPFWMPDGRVVYHGCAFLTDHAACGLFWVGAGGGEYYRLTTDSSDTAPAGFGSRVAFMSLRDGDWDVYTVNMDGSGLKRLTDNSAQDGLPTWSPDGKSIAFVSNRSGAWAIWAMDANGSNQRKLFDLGGGFGSGDYDWLHERISWAP
jgi:LysM repeat protein